MRKKEKEETKKLQQTQCHNNRKVHFKELKLSCIKDMNRRHAREPEPHRKDKSNSIVPLETNGTKRCIHY